MMMIRVETARMTPGGRVALRLPGHDDVGDSETNIFPVGEIAALVR